MKNIFKPLMTVAVFAALLTIYSCEKTCDKGYEGKDCKTEWREKFVYDNYSVEETCTRDSCGTTLPVVSPDYFSNVTAGPSIEQIKFTNFGNYGSGVVATANLDDETKFTIPSTVIGGVTFEGTGSISDAGVISLDYTVTDGCDVLTASATFTK